MFWPTQDGGQRPRRSTDGSIVPFLASGSLYCGRRAMGRPDLVEFVLSPFPNPCRYDQSGCSIDVVFVHDAKRVELFRLLYLKESACGSLTAACFFGEAAVPEHELNEARR